MKRVSRVMKLMVGLCLAQDNNFLTDVCINQSEESGPKVDENYIKIREQSDKANFGMMGEIEKEYSVPYELSVCDD